MTKNKLGAVLLSSALAITLAACGSSSKSTSSSSSAPASTSSSGGGAITGAGSTFAAPVYQQWGSTLASQGISVNYQPVGSGAGVAQLTAGTVDFAGSDPPMKDPEIAAAKAKGVPVHFPMFLGAITVSYNVPGVPSGLKLDGKTIGDIFLGKVKTWNDPEISALNAGAKLPSTPIAVIHRSDSSGTTAGFTTFLAATNPNWVKVAGPAGKDVKWPTGTGAKGNPGVAAAVKQTTGAVGYVEQAYALQNNFTVASVKNASGRFIAPSLGAATSAAQGVKVPKDLRLTISNPKNITAYPITSQTFIIVYKDMCKAGRSQTAASKVKKFIAYGLGAGQDTAKQLQYAPLPAAILTKAKAQLSVLTCNGAPLA